MGATILPKDIHTARLCINTGKQLFVASRSQIFGMTASLVNRKGVNFCADADKQLAAWERKLDSKVYAVKDGLELESFVPTPHTLEKEYEASTFNTEEYKLKLQAIAEKIGQITCLGSNSKFRSYY
jgi:hypothetical protein